MPKATNEGTRLYEMRNRLYEMRNKSCMGTLLCSSVHS